MTAGRAEVLVTGAAGFIGRHLVRACDAAGYRVTAVDLRPAPAHLIGAAHWRQDDCAAASVLDDVAAGRFAAVLHQAGVSDTRAAQGPALTESNLAGPLRIARACRAGGTRFLYASSHSVYGVLRRREPVAEGAETDAKRCSGPLNPYARSKLMLDRSMCAEFSGPELDWVGLRYTNVFGLGESDKGPMASILSQLARQAAAKGQVRLFSDTLTAARDYIPVETVSATVVRLMERAVPSGVYNLGAGHAVTFAELLEWCAEWLGRRPLRVDLVPNPVRSAYQYFTCADMRALDRVLPGRPAVTPGEVRERAAAIFAVAHMPVQRLGTAREEPWNGNRRRSS